MNTPESSHAPDLMRIVSWISVCCENVLFAIVIAETGDVSIGLTGIVVIKQTVLAEQGNQRAVRTPHHILYRRSCDLSNGLLLLDVVQHDRRRRAENQTGGTSVEDLVRLHGRLDRLHNRVREIAHFNQLQ